MSRRTTTALLLTILALFLLLPASVSAQADDSVVAQDEAVVVDLPVAVGVTARLIAPDTALTVGDPAQLTLEVIHPAGYQVFVPKMIGQWGDFEIQSQSSKTTEVNADGSETTHQIAKAVLFAPGTYQSPALTITLSDIDGNLSQAMAGPVSVEIISVLTEEDVEIRDIKPQASVAIPGLTPFLVGGALLFLVLALLGGWLIYRKLSGRTQVDNRRPEQVATDELARIGGLQLAQAGEFTEHYALVTTCLCTYIERQYHAPALEQTTSELKRTLRTTSMSDSLAMSYIELFGDCDLVKFADFKPSVDVANLLIDQAQMLVRLSAEEVAALAAVEPKNDSQGTLPPSATPTPVQA